MELFHVLKIVTVSALLTVSLSACEDAGKAQSAGKKIDQTVEKAGSKISDTADNLGMAINDTEITGKVKAAIFADPDLATLSISVDTKKGVVTLTGFVISAANSDMATVLSEEISGVKQVNNQLTIKPKQL
ncbi:BON domain-containing protein [Pseudoalteromonas tunicata]|jgi:hyperosmotically inducible protein|uniref:Transport-associated protein n=1 Tax=Pseudoalteromonas tunicata D2 TaxID=87626 RepID=A4CCP2_9GAMM|nr:BON domain-containing protein [Pseudoalteromonas tunicata]ATC93836.1 hyperosmotically inducible periplasmic protein [Pseudoalteromonas tunicata]AXT29650.1 BON domain-containing protein [Pseudoalteromonas tunicata]EAR27335.1 Transport-associated protein [Pseudoalteromonas tunicata D2]